VKLLAVLTAVERADSRELFQAHGREELVHLWGLYEEGLVREMYQRAGPGAVLVLEAPDMEHARRLLNELPLLAAGAVECELLELRPFAAYRAFIDAGG
jgi:hypothetical protein